MKFLKYYEKFILPERQWIYLNEPEREEFAHNILSLINTAYTPIGGHYKIKEIEDVIRHAEYDVWKGIDIDSDNELDVVTFGETTPYGTKETGMGQNGTPNAKGAAIKNSIKTLKTYGHYAEMSGTIADIMIKYNVPYIKDQELIEEILGKKVTWLGEDPTGRWMNMDGWYSRKIQGKPSVKIMLGIPKASESTSS